MLKKDITFIYMDSAEKSMFAPIAQEAERRGYKVTLTMDKFAKCNIGFYCQHKNYPKYSKFSFIMLHDIIQQYGNWPDIWFREPWNKYDVGILPSDQWVDNWNQSSMNYYAVPKKGMYKVGWPKADSIIKFTDEKYKKDFIEKYKIDTTKKTILYAPAWENDGKQDEFVQAMKKLDVNILIKQADWNEELFPEIVKNVKEMYELHKNDERVILLPPSMNIFEAIAVSDVLVSEESSTMCESVMMGKPAVSVSNWLIPDVTPSRFPECNYNFVNMTLKENLTEKVKEIIDNYDKYQKEAQDFSDKNFSNLGNSSTMIMDIVDDYVGKTKCRYEPLKRKKKKKLSFKKYLKHKKLQFMIEVRTNYYVRKKWFRVCYDFAKKIKNIFVRKKVNK